MGPMKSRSLTIRLDSDLVQELEALPFDEAAGGLTDDDVFAAIS